MLQTRRLRYIILKSKKLVKILKEIFKKSPLRDRVLYGGLTNSRYGSLAHYANALFDGSVKKYIKPLTMRRFCGTIYSVLV